MQIITLEELNNYKTAVTIGKFDGFHIGHRKIIDELVKISHEKDLKSLVVSFSLKPAVFFGYAKDDKSIFSKDEKLYVMNNLGIDFYLELDFDEHLANLSGDEFIRKYLFNTEAMIIGENFLFGKNKSGDKNLLQRHIRNVISLPISCYGNDIISSSKIKNAILRSDMENTQYMLSIPYFIMGTVTKGKQNGRIIGFPTANIIPDNNKMLPPNGVYITQTEISDVSYKSITNVGTNPTVYGTIKIVETHIPDYNEDLYGSKILIKFHKFIRAEKKFSNIDELKKQIQNDIKQI